VSDRDSEIKKSPHGAELGPLRTFGRTGGRSLSTRQKKLKAELLPKLSVPQLEPNTLEPASLFTDAKSEICFEIGFGGGEHLIGQATKNPNIGFIGAEPFQEGVGKVLSALDDKFLPNIRIHMDDARPVLDSLIDASLDKVFILFPDPWHKVRHNKRRLIQPEFIDTLARILKPGGQVRFATDWANYADWTLERFEKSNDFTWNAQTAADWQTPPEDHIPTRYQSKKLGDCEPIWLEFTRLPR